MIKVFISYAHEDEELRNKLEIHLATLKREGLIEPWHDRHIVAGQEIASAINANIENADIILLLVSPDFLNSGNCYEIEMPRAMTRHEEGAASVIPVILRHCDWRSAPFAELGAVPRQHH